MIFGAGVSDIFQKCCFCKHLPPGLFSIFLFAYSILIFANLTVSIDVVCNLFCFSVRSLCIKCLFSFWQFLLVDTAVFHNFWFAVFIYPYIATCVKFKMIRNVFYEFKLFGGISSFFCSWFCFPFCSVWTYSIISLILIVNAYYMPQHMFNFRKLSLSDIKRSLFFICSVQCCLYDNQIMFVDFIFGKLLYVSKFLPSCSVIETLENLLLSSLKISKHDWSLT